MCIFVFTYHQQQSFREISWCNPVLLNILVKLKWEETCSSKLRNLYLLILLNEFIVFIGCCRSHWDIVGQLMFSERALHCVVALKKTCSHLSQPSLFLSSLSLFAPTWSLSFYSSATPSSPSLPTLPLPDSRELRQTWTGKVHNHRCSLEKGLR